MLWELYQQNQIHRAKDVASRAEGKILRTDEHIRILEGKIESLSLTCQAMWELLRDNTRLSEKDLDEKVMEIDLRDGVADGKMGGAARSCTECGRKVSGRHKKCLYCGTEIGKEHVFKV